MNRRELIQGTAALSLATLLPGAAQAQALFAPKPGAWRSIDLVTRLDIDKPDGKMQAWIPIPSVNESEWMRPGETKWTGNAAKVERIRDPKYGMEMLHVMWKDGESAPGIEVVSRVAMRDRDIDLSKPGTVKPLGDAERKLNLEGT